MKAFCKLMIGSELELHFNGAARREKAMSHANGSLM